jgi:hypothetical protein
MKQYLRKETDKRPDGQDYITTAPKEPPNDVTVRASHLQRLLN